MAETMPPSGAGRDALQAWLYAHVQGSAAPVTTHALAQEAVRLGWQRYAVHTLLSELYRAGAITLLSPGCYLRLKD